jgi:hypothetical protein
LFMEIGITIKSHVHGLSLWLKMNSMFGVTKWW